ncbi:EAL domain-containing protein [Roseococcus sp. SDR]|uniref:sensor domain-containing phosphodiesterase n=1 Tax=Roseococcus sp. SDR TaxID=2835532 RepID=UPI001BCC9227|nr:EAL domain-containing protein [Roseococcus sp. SDR]MBS7789001.1 EAL domain-containing protein [Roseococcus sp. SDR]MBV1844315.1 EAL domain-containing protein [Roseococcus sp. SDR]
MNIAARRPLGDRERFVAFAFAGADMLVETNLEGQIAFTAGAFRHRFGAAPESFMGQDLATLIAPSDRGSFAAALAMMPERGRLSPTVIRLANAEQTPFVVAGLHLALPGEPARLCLSMGPVPIPLDPAADAPPTAVALLREAETRLRRPGAGAGGLSLIEVSGPMTEEMRAALTSQSGNMAAELAPGRYGLLSACGASARDLAAVTERLEAVLRQQGQGGSVSGGLLPLDGGALSPVQAVRALRHGLATFTRAGAAGLREEGFNNGLSGFVEQITARAGTIRRAIAQRRFHLDYQPIMGLGDRALHHYEALLRPEKGLLGTEAGPQDFVTLAETVGLTEELDLAVTEVALQAAHALSGAQRIAVNISGLSLQSTAFRKSLDALLDAHPAAGQRLMVELTESAEIEEEAAAAATLESLRGRGIPVCLDDFGAGSAAFRYLKAFPVDYVKVDGSFVEAAMRSERDRSFVASMVDLSVAVGARVVAERIETEEMALMMRGLGVHLGQGWHFGRPGPLPKLQPVAVARRSGAQESWG